MTRLVKLLAFAMVILGSFWTGRESIHPVVKQSLTTHQQVQLDRIEHVVNANRKLMLPPANPTGQLPAPFGTVSYKKDGGF